MSADLTFGPREMTFDLWFDLLSCQPLFPFGMWIFGGVGVVSAQLIKVCDCDSVWFDFGRYYLVERFTVHPAVHTTRYDLSMHWKICRISAFERFHCSIQNFNFIQIELVPFLVLVDGCEREWIALSCSQFVFVRPGEYSSTGMIRVALVAVHAVHACDVFLFPRFELFF